jgi:hypothetical protein
MLDRRIQDGATKSLQLEGTSAYSQLIGRSQGILARSFVHEWTKKNAPVVRDQGDAQIDGACFDRGYTTDAGSLLLN